MATEGHVSIRLMSLTHYRAEFKGPKSPDLQNDKSESIFCFHDDIIESSSINNAIIIHFAFHAIATATYVYLLKSARITNFYSLDITYLQRFVKCESIVA